METYTLKQLNDFVRTIEEKERELRATKKKKNRTVIKKVIPLNENLSINAVTINYDTKSVMVYFSDKTYTRARAMTSHFDKQVGFTVCICKKLLGTKNYYALLNALVPEAKIIKEDKNETKPVKTEKSTCGKDKTSCKGCTCSEKAIKTKNLSESDYINMLGTFALYDAILR